MIELTTAEVARRLGIAPRTVSQHARSLNAGRLLTPRMRVYSEADVARIAERVGQRGRPKTSND